MSYIRNLKKDAYFEKAGKPIPANALSKVTDLSFERECLLMYLEFVKI